jgi:hypothetical protein
MSMGALDCERTQGEILMTRFLAAVTALALAVPALAQVPSYTEGPVPKKVGQCVATRISALSSRIENVPDSGSGVSHVNGLWQVSCDIIPGLVTARVGDSVKICLKSIPEDCPKGGDRGKIYSATDLRTKKSWEAPDAQHSCGGA